MAEDEIKKEDSDKKEKPPIEFKLDIGGTEFIIILLAIGIAIGWFLRNLL